MMAKRICPQCGRENTQQEARFCFCCGARLMAPIGNEAPAGAQALLDKAALTENNKKKLKLLRQAREEYPDCLAVEEEWLFYGKLPEKPSMMLDFSGIKSHLLMLYLEPEAFSAPQRESMRQELFHAPELEKCIALSDDAQGYLAHYLQRLSREFIQVFLMGSNEYMPRFFGMRLERNTAKVLAEPAARVLSAIAADEALLLDEREALMAAFRLAFSAECGGEMRWLEQALKQ